MVNKHQPPLKSDIGVNSFPCYDCSGTTPQHVNTQSQKQADNLDGDAHPNNVCGDSNTFPRSYSSPSDYAAHLLEDIHRAEAQQPLKGMHRRRANKKDETKNNDVRLCVAFYPIVYLNLYYI